MSDRPVNLSYSNDCIAKHRALEILSCCDHATALAYARRRRRKETTFFSMLG